MFKRLLLLSLSLLFLGSVAIAQDAEEAPKDGWDIGLGLGFDFAQLLQLNPKVGSGENRIGFGGAANVFANKKQGRFSWDNTASLQFGVQKLGAGVIALGSDEKIPFQKSIDLLKFDSKVGYKTSEDSKFFYAAALGFMSQLTPTYFGSFLKDLGGSPYNDANPIAKLFSPAHLTISAGIDYKPQDNLSFYFSPIAYKAIIVADDNIADNEAFDGDGVGKAVSVHGNPWTSTSVFDNAFNQFGALLRGNYNNKFLEDKIAFQSALTLYSNYLNNPQNIDVEWNNEFAFNIYKGLQLSLLLNFFYDHDVLVNITDFKAPNAINGLGRRLNVTEQILLKYNIVF